MLVRLFVCCVTSIKERLGDRIKCQPVLADKSKVSSKFAYVCKNRRHFCFVKDLQVTFDVLEASLFVP